MDWPLIILFGFCVAVLIGMTGVGGESPMTPAPIHFARERTAARIRAMSTADRPQRPAPERA